MIDKMCVTEEKYRNEVRKWPEERSMKILFRDIAASSMIRFITRRLQFENLM